MLGSSNSIACANIMLNAAVAESLKQFTPTVWKAPMTSRPPCTT